MTQTAERQMQLQCECLKKTNIQIGLLKILKYWNDSWIQLAEWTHVQFIFTYTYVSTVFLFFLNINCTANRCCKFNKHIPHNNWNNTYQMLNSLYFYSAVYWFLNIYEWVGNLSLIYCPQRCLSTKMIKIHGIRNVFIYRCFSCLVDCSKWFYTTSHICPFTHTFIHCSTFISITVYIRPFFSLCRAFYLPYTQ